MFDINEEMTYLVYVMQKRMRRQMSTALDRDDITLEQYVVKSIPQSRQRPGDPGPDSRYLGEQRLCRETHYRKG